MFNENGRMVESGELDTALEEVGVTCVKALYCH